MLAAIVRFSLRFHGIIIALALLVLCYGGYLFSQAGLDIFPEFAPKRVIVQTESPGLSAEQVETLVTLPLETAISGLVGLESVRSESIQGLSVITATFAETSDVYRNRQLVSERLVDSSTRLPKGITPVVVPLSSASATILTIGLVDPKQDLMALRTLVDRLVVPRLLAVQGVADVNVFGGDVQQLQIQVDPVKLSLMDVSIDEVIATASTQASLQGGFIDNGNQRFTLQLTGQPSDPKHLGKMLLALPNPERRIALEEVAAIRYAPEPPISAAQIMGKPGIVMMVIGQYDVNTLTVSRKVEQALSELEPVFKQSGYDFYQHLFRPADYIERSHQVLSGHLLIGGVFVLAVLGLFLLNLRAAFISALAIPVSLLAAVMVLLAAGVNLNIMVLGGLAIALGEVVDDAIIDTENIFRRLRENRQLATPLTIDQVVCDASLEVRGSVVYASFIVALVFVPLLTLEGVAGRLFAPLGWSYILAILASLLVALTLTPALCRTLLSTKLDGKPETPVVRCLLPFYRQSVFWVSRRFWLVITLGLAVCLMAVVSLWQRDSKFLPELREGHYIVHTSSIPGTSLQESIRIGGILSKQMLAIAGVASVSQWAGRAERGADTYGSHYSEYEVRLKPLSGDGQQRVLEHIRELMSKFPGIAFEANTFLTERVDETISGYTSPVVINLYGNDLANLDQIAQQVAVILGSIDGAQDVQVRSPPETPLISLQMDLGQLNFYGVQPQQIAAALRAAYQTQVVGKVLENGRTFDLAVTLTPELRQQTETMSELPVRTAFGQLVKLGQVANLGHESSRYNILHQDTRRKQTVTCGVENRDLDGFMAELKQRVGQKISFPKHSYPEFTGAAVEQAQARQNLILHALLITAGVLMLIYMAINNFRHVLLTLANLPFALIGGIFAVWWTGAVLSVGSIVGFITLFGITVRNTIMLFSHYRHLVEIEGKPWSMATAIQGAEQRLPAILMTALVTALAMLPIAFDSDNPGREIMGPMAAIIIGGLVSSTVLNLLLMPVVLVRFGRF